MAHLTVHFGQNASITVTQSFRTPEQLEALLASEWMKNGGTGAWLDCANEEGQRARIWVPASAVITIH